MKHNVRDRFKSLVQNGRRSQYIKAALAIALILFVEALPSLASAQCAPASTGTGSYSNVFGGASGILNAALQFFYGPFFKIACAIAFIVAGVMLIMRGDEMNQAVSVILRGIMIVAVIVGIVSWILGMANGSTVSAC